MDKIALITGANRGLGLEIARQLGKKGIHILVGARKEEAGKAAAAQLNAEGIKAEFLQLEITDKDSISKAVSTVESNFGRLDILVNNAALVPTERHVPSTTSIEVLQEFMQVNYFAPVMVTQAFLPLIRKSPAGRIVNMSSSVGSATVQGEPIHKNPNREPGSSYGPTKAALNLWTVVFARELRDTPIKINCADPSWTKTDAGGPNALYTVEQGAIPAVWLACLDEHGPTGCFFTHYMEHVKANPW